MCSLDFFHEKKKKKKKKQQQKNRGKDDKGVGGIVFKAETCNHQL